MPVAAARPPILRFAQDDSGRGQDVARSVILSARSVILSAAKDPEPNGDGTGTGTGTGFIPTRLREAGTDSGRQGATQRWIAYEILTKTELSVRNRPEVSPSARLSP